MMKNSNQPSLVLCPNAPSLAGVQASPDVAAGAWTPSKDEWFTPWRFTGLLFLLILAAYPDVMLGKNSFFYRDYGYFGYPLAHYHRDAFWRGELPFWNSLSNCGLPYLAQWNTMTLYPLSLIYLLLPMPWALGYFCIGHLILGGAGMYCLAHRWTGNRFASTIAGLGYALNGLTLHSLMWPNNIAALGWMPFVVLFAEKGVREGGRPLVLAALVGTVQMLAGAPEIILFTWLLAAACCLTMRETPLRVRCGRFALAGLLVAMLAAAQLLPFIDLLLHSQRDQSFATNTWAMPAWGWANLLVPLFHCTPSIVGVYSQDAQQWTSSYYAGIGMTAMALLGALRWRERRSLLLSLAALFALLLALGSAGGIYTGLKQVFPFLGMVRYPIKFVVVAIFALPLLAAIGVARLQTDSAPARRQWIWTCGLLVALVGCILAVGWRHPVPGERWEVTAQSGLSRVALLCGVGLLLLWIGRVNGVRGLGLRAGLLVVLGVDALTHTPRQNPTVPVAAMADDVIRRGGRFTNGARVMVSAPAQSFFNSAANANAWEFCLGNRRALVPNWNLVEGIASAGGFYSLYTPAQYELRSLWAKQTKTNQSPALADVLGVRWITSELNIFGLDKRPTALPLVAAGLSPVFANRDEALRALTSSSFHPDHEVLLPREANGQIRVTNSAGARVGAIRRGASFLEADVESDGPTLVTIAQTAYSGWSATVNDQPAHIWPANHAFQAVEIPAGPSRVRLTYRERTFRLGATLSLVALLACATLWWRGRGPREAASSRTAPA
jgi:hypothetical protein